MMYRVLLISIFLCLSTAFHSACADSEAWKQTTNNNRVISIQTKGGNPELTGDVSIDFYGHAAFLITSPTGLKILFDPWRNDPSGAWGLWFPKAFPQVETDVVLSTHAHFDHDAVYRPVSSMVLDRMSGGWEFADVRISGLADKHVCVSPGVHAWHKAFDETGIEGCPPNNPGHMDNVIFLVQTGNKRIVIWGDNRANPPARILEQLSKPDLLILPIDSSEHLLSYEESDSIIDTLKPKLVVPAHYLTDGVSSVLSTLGDAKTWINRHSPSTGIAGPTFVLNDTTLRNRDRHVVYFLSSHQPD